MRHQGQDAKDSIWRADAKDFIQNFEAFVARAKPCSQPPVIDRIRGMDQSGTVSCFVDIRGTPLDVKIDENWWNRVGSRGIAAAIIAAFDYGKSKAAMARMVLERQGFAQNIQLPFPRPEPVPPLPSPDDTRYDEALQLAIDQMSATLSFVEKFSQIRDSVEPRIISGPRGLFKIIIVGFSIKEAKVNLHGLTASDGRRIAMDARDVLIMASQLPDLTIQGR